jgi:hypothetical protein
LDGLDSIDIARRAGRRLIICGIVQDERYFRELVLPHVDGGRVSYLGSVGPTRRAEILGSAAALLHPLAFAEPSTSSRPPRWSPKRSSSTAARSGAPPSAASARRAWSTTT